MPAVRRAIAGEVVAIGLWGDTPDGPAECSFGNYRRVQALDGHVTTEGVSWSTAAFGPVSVVRGVEPAGWALFDADGLMIHCERAQMGRLRRTTRWDIAPRLTIERVP